MAVQVIVPVARAGVALVGRQAAKTAVKQGVKVAAKKGAKAAATKGAKVAAGKGAKAAASKSASKVFRNAIPTLSRLATNPGAAKRFLKTRAGKTALFNFGIDLLNTKDAQKAIESFISNRTKSGTNNPKMDAAEKKYQKAKARTSQAKSKMSGKDLTAQEVQELTEVMKQSIAEMHEYLEILEQNQSQLVAASARER